MRNTEKSGWVKDLFDKKYGPGKFELIEVPEMSTKGAFDDAVKGASGPFQKPGRTCAHKADIHRGFIHVATPVMVNYDPNKGVPIVVDGAINMLTAAKKEPSIKRGVMTSSSTAAADPIPNKEFTIDEQTWNTASLEAAWAPPPYEGVARKLAVYSASKLESERAAWKFMEKEKPGFVLNTVLPNANLGVVLDPKHQGTPSTIGWLHALWNGFRGQEDIAQNPPQYFINVQDNARVHVAALICPDVQSERLFTFAKAFNWNDLLAIYRKNYPNRTFIDNMPDSGRDLSTVSNGRAEELLKRFGLPGWTSLEQSVKDSVWWDAEA